MNTDDLIVGSLDCVLPVFCYLNIHPNFITLAALVLSALIPYFHINKQYKYVIACIIIRQLCDILDGAVARKCKKTSKLGGYLDTLADTIFFFSKIFVFLSFYIKDKTKTCIITSFILFSLLLIHVSLFDMNVLHNHTKLKNNYNTTSIYKYLFALGTNNTMIIFSSLALIYFRKINVKNIM